MPVVLFLGTYPGEADSPKVILGSFGPLSLAATLLRHGSGGLLGCVLPDDLVLLCVSDLH